MAKQDELTPAQTRAMQAVRDGLAYRIYRRNGNVIKGPPGIGASALRSLERCGLIRDEPTTLRFGVQIRVKLVIKGK